MTTKKYVDRFGYNQPELTKIEERENDDGENATGGEKLLNSGVNINLVEANN